MGDTLIDGGEWQPIPCEKLDNTVESRWFEVGGRR